MMPQPPLTWDDQVAGRNWVKWNGKEEQPHEQGWQHHLRFRAVISQKCGIKIVISVDYGVHRHSTNRADQREVHINGFQRLLKPAKAGNQTVCCAKHHHGLSACFTDILGNSRYSSTTEQAMKLAPACHKAMKWLGRAECHEKTKLQKHFWKETFISIAGVREKQQRSCAQHMLRLERFLPPD